MTENTTLPMRDVYIVDGARTPFLKAKGKPGPFSASDLAVRAGRELLQRQPFAPTDLDEIIVGCVMPSVDESNIARFIALRLVCGNAVPAWTVQRNCASGMQALDSAVKDIATGRCNLIMAGGTEAMSRAPLLFNDEMTNWFAGVMSAKNWKNKLKEYLQFRPWYLKPVIALIRGLRDPTVNLNMGQTAENLAYRFHISRGEMDEFAYNSHKRVMKAQEDKYFKEVETVYADNGSFFPQDDGVRVDTTLEK